MFLKTAEKRAWGKVKIANTVTTVAAAAKWKKWASDRKSHERELSTLASASTTKVRNDIEGHGGDNCASAAPQTSPWASAVSTPEEPSSRRRVARRAPASAGHTLAPPLPSAVGTQEHQPLQVQSVVTAQEDPPPPSQLREQPSAPGAKEGLGQHAHASAGRASPPPVLSAVSTPTQEPSLPGRVAKQEPLPQEQASASGSTEGPGEAFHVLCQKFASMGKNSKVRKGGMWDFVVACFRRRTCCRCYCTTFGVDFVCCVFFLVLVC